MQQPDPFPGRRTPAEVASLGSDALLTELSVTFEELNVAEQELREQNEALLRAQAAMGSERERYRELFEHAPVAYFVTDRHGVITDANRAAERMLRCSVRYLLGKPLAVFTRDVSRRRMRRAMFDLRAGGSSVTTTFNVRNRAGRTRRVEATVSTIHNLDGSTAGLRWLLVDRTRRLKRARQERERAAELERLVQERTAELEAAQHTKDELIATVSHEFRTALAAIGGYAELLEIGIHGDLTRDQKQDVGRIKTAYEHLAHVVDDLLNYSRLVTGRLVVDIGETIVHDVVRPVAEMMEPLARTKNLAMTVERIEPALSVLADSERVKQILINLIGNAIKFTPSGGKVSVSSRATDSTVAIEVCDTGLGIPDESLERVFEPFVRLRNSAGESGTGLGLSISRDLARAMNGTLVVRSAYGEGSHFILTLPRSTRLAGEWLNG